MMSFRCPPMDSPRTPEMAGESRPPTFVYNQLSVNNQLSFLDEFDFNWCLNNFWQTERGIPEFLQVHAMQKIFKKASTLAARIGAWEGRTWLKRNGVETRPAVACGTG